MTTQQANLVLTEANRPTKTVSIWLVRHGQTDANLIGRYQGHLDLPLNETGREQVVTMGAQLREELETRGITSVQALYSSDLVRTRETAQAVADSLGMEIIPDARLREIHMGDWEGAYFTEIREQFPAIVEQRYRDPMHIAPPNGETTFDVAKRMWPALDAYAARHHGDDPIVVVSHGMAIATVICRIRGISLARVFEVVPGNAEVTMIDWEPTSPGWIEDQEALSQR
jgi:broad specificity phosphatase PhoE